MKEVLLEKYMDFPTIGKVSQSLLNIVGLKKVLNPVATRIPNWCKKVLVDIISYFAQLSAWYP
jgi:hypothetical protein